VLVVAVVAVAATRLGLVLAGASWRRVYFAPDTTFDAILVGALAVLAAVVGVVAIRSHLLYEVLLTPFAVAAAVVILSLAVGAAWPLRVVLSTAPLVFLGRISYALYLWHPMILWFGRREAGIPAGAGIALSIAVATASYFLVELPFLHLKNRGRPDHDPAEVPVSQAGAGLPARVRARAASVLSIRPAAGIGAKNRS
jgi:peptidoglycan/LPS O-acetylase OafA/YrhL